MQKIIKNIFLVLLFLLNTGLNPVFAAFDVKGVQLFRDNNICINSVSDGTTSKVALDLSTLQTNSESVQSKISSSGSLCTTPPFFTGGAILSTAGGITTQAQPNIQSLGRGILISEIAGNSSGISSSGDPNGFSTLVSNLGGLANTIFEISLPTGCDVIDDDDDIVGASSDLTTVNDFSLPTCTSTNGLTVQCNATSNLLTLTTGLAPASGSTPAKVRFTLSAINAVPDSNMIDSILIRLSSQDVFCPSTATGPLIATVVAQNAVSSPTKSETIGTADLGTAKQAAKINYATETVTSTKGETSTNEIGTTPILAGSTSTAHKIQIEELDNESIPIGGQSSAVLINPTATSNAATENINLWIIPSISSLFSNAPAISDITFSDNSIFISSAPVLVKTTANDVNAPFGSIVIPIRKSSGGTDPATIKTTITINNLKINSGTGKDGDIFTVTLALFEPASGAVINTPAGLSVNDSTNPTNPQNFSAFSVDSTRGLAQNAVVGGAVNEPTGAAQITTDTDLSALTKRDTVLGAPQILNFTKVISSISDINTDKITVLNSNSILTVTGAEGASISGAGVNIESFANSSMTAFDLVTLTSKSDGSFNAKLQADFSGGDVSLSFKQTVSGTDSQTSTKIVKKDNGGFSCEQTVCGCENANCTPTVTQIQTYIQNNGGLSNIVTGSGEILQEVIQSVKKALGLS